MSIKQTRIVSSSMVHSPTAVVVTAMFGIKATNAKENYGHGRKTIQAMTAVIDRRSFTGMSGVWCWGVFDN